MKPHWPRQTCGMGDNGGMTPVWGKLICVVESNPHEILKWFIKFLTMLLSLNYKSVNEKYTVKRKPINVDLIYDNKKSWFVLYL